MKTLTSQWWWNYYEFTANYLDNSTFEENYNVKLSKGIDVPFKSDGTKISKFDFQSLQYE